MAEQFNDLYDLLTSYENLFFAFQKAAKGKRGNSSVAEFANNEDDLLFALQEELKSKTYRPGAYTSFYIRDPKRRLVSAAPFRDRVVHHALCNVIEPIFERTFIGDSYANRIGKGVHSALDRTHQFSRQYPYVLQCDVEQCFPSIDHAVLKKILARKIADVDVLWLCDRILKSGEGVLSEEYKMNYFSDDDLFAVQRPRGLPIGNLTSQFWANVYMNELDQFIKRKLRVKAYVRYVDDFLLFSENKRQLWEWKRGIIKFLESLRMTLHVKESSVYPVSTGIPFLGFRQYPTHRLLKSRNGHNFVRRFKSMKRQLAHSELSYADMQNRVQGWVAHASHASTWGLRRSLFQKSIPKAQGVRT